MYCSNQMINDSQVKSSLLEYRASVRYLIIVNFDLSLSLGYEKYCTLRIVSETKLYNSVRCRLIRV